MKKTGQKIEDYNDVKEKLKFYPPIESIEQDGDIILKVTIPENPVTRRKLFESALLEKMDKLGYKQIWPEKEVTKREIFKSPLLEYMDNLDDVEKSTEIKVS